MSRSTRLRHVWLALTTLPGLIGSREQRALLAEMRRFGRQLPDLLKQPLPEARQQLTPLVPSQITANPDLIRRLADLAALLDRRSPLGLCLRRSLIRYHFLRRNGLPIEVLFGAKFIEPQPDRRLTGHAWTVLDDAPYHEVAEDWQGFTVMLRWP